MQVEISPRSGIAFQLRKGHRLRVTDPQGEQVSDLIAFNLDDTQEYLSSGRTLDYASKLFLTTGDVLYSNRSRPMFQIGEDCVRRHDFLLTPCSADTFRILYGHEHPHRGCSGNLSEALAPFGIAPDQIPITFNIFMNVDINGESGKITVKPPQSRAGDYVDFVAQMDLIVGLTACSAEQSNNYRFKPIVYEVFEV